MILKIVRQMYPHFAPSLKILAVVGIGMLALVSLYGAEALAQTPDKAVLDAIAEGFKPVEGGKPVTEEVNASMLVVCAYGAFALAFIAYLLHLGRQQAHLAKELVDISTRIDTATQRES